MNAFHAIYVVLFAGAGFTCLGALVQIRRLSSRGVKLGLGGLLALSGLWGLAVVVQLLVSPLWMKRLAYTGGLVAGFGTVFTWLYFVSAYTGRQYHTDRKLVAAGVAIFGLAAAVKLTNPIHGAYFTATLRSTPFPHMAISHSAIHWMFTGVAYALSGLGFWILYDAFRGRETPATLYLLVGAIALPVVPFLLALVVPDLLLPVNYEPIGVAIFAVGVLFFVQDSFLELSAPGRSQLVDVLSEGVVLLDENDRIVSCNDHAEEPFPELAGEHSLSAIDDDLASLAVGQQCVVTTTVDGATRHYQAQKKEIETGPQYITAAMTLTDVTRLAHLEEVTRVHSKVNEAIIEERTTREMKERICDALAAVDAYRFVWIATRGESGVAPMCVAGDPDGYLTDETLQSTDGDGDPVVRAVRQPKQAPGAVEMVDDDSDASWHRRAAAMGVTTCMAMSLDPGGETTEVLGIYTTDEEGFTEPEQAMFAEIRETLQHAVSAIQAHEEARQLQEAVDQAGYALFITDTNGEIRYVNPAFEEITGYDASEALGQTPDLLSENHDSAAVWDGVTGGDIWRGDVQSRQKSGERYWARRTVAPVTDETGQVTAVVAIDVDVTDERVRQQRLSVLNRVLRHNLRNRMNVIAGNANLVLDRGETEVTEPAERIRDTASKLIDLSEKAHTAEQLIDAGERTEGEADLGTILDDLRSELAAEFPDATVDVSVPEEDVPVDGALRPALVELAHNGLEHGGDSPHLRIDVAVECTQDRDRKEVVLTVDDDGPGLPDQERDVLEHGDESALKHGSGLGLWLVNWLVLQSGGWLDIDTSGPGTTVTVRVPVRPERDAQAPDSPTPQ